MISRCQALFSLAASTLLPSAHDPREVYRDCQSVRHSLINTCIRWSDFSFLPPYASIHCAASPNHLSSLSNHKRLLPLTQLVRFASFSCVDIHGKDSTLLKGECSLFIGVPSLCRYRQLPYRSSAPPIIHPSFNNLHPIQDIKDHTVNIANILKTLPYTSSINITQRYDGKF